MPLHTQTLTELAAGLAEGDFTSVEVTQTLLDRIAAHNDKLNAYITVCDESALKQAKAADAARALAGGHVGGTARAVPRCRPGGRDSAGGPRALALGPQHQVLYSPGGRRTGERAGRPGRGCGACQHP